jgi:hypothetical protein
MHAAITAVLRLRFGGVIDDGGDVFLTTDFTAAADLSAVLSVVSAPSVVKPHSAHRSAEAI